MKILHISKRDSGGGAATACERLHRGLLGQGADSWVLCDVPSGGVPKVIGLRKRTGLFNLVQRIKNRVSWKITRPPLFFEPNCHTTFSLNMTRNHLLAVVKKLNPDIVNLHWVGSGFLRIEDLRLLASEFPVVWTLHDMWPFCGAEHYAYTDNRWKEGYSRRNRDPSAKGPDWNYWVGNRKRVALTGVEIHTVGVSRWINECVENSRIFQGASGLRRCIHNGLDTEVFRPIETQQKSTSRCGTINRPWRILFGAVSQSDRIKGGDLLLDSLNLFLRNRQIEMELTTFGNQPLVGDLSIPYKNYGRINCPAKLAALIAVSDITIVPSRLESFGQVAAESIACGTPVVCFDTSGLVDIVDHKKNGYRARCYDPEDLANGIGWCMKELERDNSLREHARRVALERFQIADIAGQTLKLYEEILNVRTP